MTIQNLINRNRISKSKADKSLILEDKIRVDIYSSEYIGACPNCKDKNNYIEYPSGENTAILHCKECKRLIFVEESKDGSLDTIYIYKDK